MANIPPPPAGFTLDTPQSAPPTPEPRQYISIGNNVPPPPPGFTLDAVPQQSGSMLAPAPDPSRVVGANGRAPGTDLSSYSPPSTINSVGRSVASGVPIIGGVLNSLDAATNATLAPVLNPLFDPKDQLTGDWNSRYQQSLNIQNANDAQFHQEHPVADTAAHLAGAVGSAIPVAAAAPALFGAGEGPLAGRVLAGTFGGTGIGAADAITRSNGDPRSVAAGAIVGGLAGAAGPAIGQALGNAYEGATTGAAQDAAARAAGASRPAVDVVTRALAADNSLGNAGANMAAAGPRAMLADAGPSTQSVLDAAIQRAGPEAGAAAQRIQQRAAGATSDINNALDNAFGLDQGMLSPLEELRTATQPARRAAYEAAYAQPIDYASPQGQALQNIVETRVPQSAINAANDLMRTEGYQSQQILANVADDGTITYQRLPDVRQLDYITRGLNQVAQEADGKGALGGTTPVGRAYGDLAGTIRDIVRSPNMVPEYDAALKIAQAPIQQRQAMEFGQTLLNPATTRDEAQSFISGLNTNAQRQAVQGGVRASIAEKLANVTRAASDPNVDARQGIQAIRDLSSDAARQKVAMVLGDDEANSFFNRLDQAARSFDLRAAVNTNSRTYARQAAQAQVDQLTAPGVVETIAQGKPLEAGKTLAQKLLGTGPEAQLGRQDQAWGDIANLLTQPANPDTPFFQAISSAAGRLPVIAQNAAALNRGTTLGTAALASPLHELSQSILPRQRRQSR